MSKIRLTQIISCLSILLFSGFARAESEIEAKLNEMSERAESKLQKIGIDHVHVRIPLKQDCGNDAQCRERNRYYFTEKDLDDPMVIKSLNYFAQVRIPSIMGELNKSLKADPNLKNLEPNDVVHVVLLASSHVMNDWQGYLYKKKIQGLVLARRDWYGLLPSPQDSYRGDSFHASDGEIAKRIIRDWIAQGMAENRSVAMNLDPMESARKAFASQRGPKP